MKYNLYILICVVVFCSCKTTSMSYAQNYHEHADKTILDSLQYIVQLPNDNEVSYQLGDSIIIFHYPFGDSISEKIIKKGEILIPGLIEKIKDTTKTKIRVADFYDYTVSDVAITLIEYIYWYHYKKIPPIGDMLISVYNNDIDMLFIDGDISSKLLYFITFFSDNEEYNYKNRLRFYNRVRIWYEKQK